MNKKNEYINAIDEIQASENLKRKTMYKIKEKKQIKFPYKLANAMTIVLVLFGIIFISDSTKITQNIEQQAADSVSMGLPTVDNIDNLIEILKEREDIRDYYKTSFDSLADMKLTNSALAESAMTDTASRKEYSTTNTQVKGIDEADIVKTDGEYIYYISKNKLVIVKAGTDLKIVSEIEYINVENEYINPQEMYIDGNKLIMIVTKGNASRFFGCYDMLYETGTTTKAITYDITKKEKPVVYKEFEIEGSYITSRMANHTMYLIANKYIPYNNEEIKQEDLMQKYTDSTKGENQYIDLAKVGYVKDYPDNSYLNIVAFDTQTKREAEINTILGAGNNVYMNGNNIYVTKTDYSFRTNEESKTIIYKFEINRTKIKYIAEAKVPGSIINQYSMDEYNGNFRIATTKSSKIINNLYILNSNLEQIGKIENIAEGENIYSVRFMGDKGYVVTFKQVDPLFVIDLKEPTQPKMLGELKIPGYSTYMHPYDETHIIGFGQDTQAKGSNVEITGMKMAIFDVTDPTNPQELFSTKIGDIGTYSTILYNPKALLFSKEKNILAFPITINEATKTSSRSNLTFQGAIVYSIDLTNGFTEKGRIAHMEITNGYKDYDYKQEVERIIYIDNDLYTLSPGTIKRTDMNKMTEQNKVTIELKEDKLEIVN